MSLKKYAFLSFGAAVMALALNLFLIPGRIAPGGISGLAVVIGYFTSFPAGLLIFLINIPVLIWGLIEFNGKFLFDSLVGTALLSVFTQLFSGIDLSVSENDILRAVFGGAMLGFGVGTVFVSGSTTGGTEVIAKILRKKFPYFSIGFLVMITDAAVIVLSAAVTKKWETFLYSGLSLYISSKVIDSMVNGLNFAKMALIISDMPKKIENAIYETVGRGTTEIFAYSEFSKTHKKVIMCIVRPNELIRLRKMVKEIDEKSFFIVADVREVAGQGFTSDIVN